LHVGTASTDDPSRLGGFIVPAPLIQTSLLCAALVAICAARSSAEPPEQKRDVAETALSIPPHPNIPTKTLGGREFWGDVAFRQGWRIQQNVFTDHFRLIDPADVRQAWGTERECRAKLAEIAAARSIAPMTGKAVILIHGIGRSSKSMWPLVRPLQEDGYTVVPFDYPSTRIPIEESAAYLRRVIESLEGIDEIDLVVHSMGGLVVRSSLAGEPDKRLRRMVMLGVPNLGAEMASLVENQPLFRAIYGEAGQQLVGGQSAFAAGLPTPKFEFAVIAGARGTGEGFNPLIPGDDDGTVTVASTRLPGARDFLTVSALHSLLIGNRDAIAATRRFLKEGMLRENGPREPIAAPRTASRP